MRGSAVVWLTPEEARQKWCVKSTTPTNYCAAGACMGWIHETEPGEVIRPATKGCGMVPPRPAEHVWVHTGRGRCGLVRA